MKIFVSSTYEDLKDERKEAIMTIDRIGQAVAMEKFFASDHQSKQVCVSKLQQCDAIIVILGFRYGHIDPEEDISITEIEYNTAKSLGLPAFVFLKRINEKQGWQSQETDPKRMAKHNAFKARLDSERFRSSFATPDQLGKEIIGAIRQYEVNHGILGARIPAFVPPEEFFKPFIDSSKLFNHNLPLVGRINYLEQLKNFVLSQKRVAIMYGRGGIGKSKILFEFSRSYIGEKSSPRLLFVREGVVLSDETLRQLPAQPCVIVVDDAHRREDLKFLFAATQQYPDRIKLILSGRPEGKDYINATLTQVGFDTREIEELEDLKELELSEVRRLAEQVLGPTHEHLVDALVAATKDCLLATVIGGRLISEDVIDPKMLDRHSEFQYAVFNRFQEIIVGEVSKKINPELCRSLLSHISALSPIRPQDERFQKQAAQFLKVERFKLVDAIGTLEENGILLRRGYQLRITPDILSDHILYNSCLTAVGDNTGYAKQIFDAFCNIMPENVLLNLAELDWRISREGKRIDFLSDIWKVVEDEFSKTSHLGRKQILSWLERISYFQPQRVLALVEYAMHNPASGKDTGPFAGFVSFSHSDVLAGLPNVIRGVSYNLGYLPRCCDLLWELGCDDARSTNSHPDHAIRILENLAGYDIGKPVKVNDTVLEAVERILKRSDAHDHLHSPLDILDPMLAKEGDTARSEGYKVVFRPFAVSFENTKPIRERTIELLAECTRSESPRIVLRSLKSLTNALRNPIGLFGRPISEREISQWLPEQTRILEIISNLVKTTRNPVIHVSISSELQWYSKRASQKKIKEKAREIIESIPDSFELCLTRAMWNRYERDWDGEDYSLFRKRVDGKVKQAATEFLSHFSDSKKIFDYLNGRLKYFQECAIDANPTFFLSKIAEENPKIACQVCELIIGQTHCPLEIHLHSMLYAIRQADKPAAIVLIKSAVKKRRRDMCLSIAHAYAWGGWHQDFDREDIKIIKDLLGHPDREVKIKTIESLRNFKGKWQRAGIDLAVATNIGEDEKLADKLCEIFDSQYGISPDALTDDDIKTILSKFSHIKELSDHLYYIDKFLGYVTQRDPLLSARLLIDRYKFAIEQEKSNREYQPMPYLGFSYAFKGISSQAGYNDILREVCDLALEEKGLSSFWLPRLFSELADGFCPKSLEILKEWINSGDNEKIESASLLLREAPPSFVFDDSGFVKNLLEQAYAKGEECYRIVSSNLFGSATSGGQQGTPGQPMPQDVALRDRAEKMCQELVGSSPSWRFYDSLKKHAEGQIRDSLARDEEILES